MKNQNESLTRETVDVAADKPATEDRYKNAAATSADNTEEGMSHSSIVTSACVAYRCAVNTSERIDSVVYDYPFRT